MRILLDILMFLVGWLICMWWHGLLIPVATATKQAQAAGEQMVVADKRITAATESLGEARVRYKTITKEVPVYVSADCPAGAVPISEPAAERLRAAISKASGLQSESADAVRETGN